MREDQRSFEARTETDGTTVLGGEETQVNLDTSVLFEENEATLTGEAQDSLALPWRSCRDRTDAR